MAAFTPPPADAVRARLLLAGRDEFAAVGLAASRIERISAASSSNKAQIFHYFGSKEGLFDAVVAQSVAETLEDVPLDTDDLPEYAGRLHDSYARRPWALRLATWYRLERQDASPVEDVVVANEAVVSAIEHAQRAGVVSRSYRPAVLLALVLTTAAMWSTTPAGFEPLVRAVTPARRRQIVVDAVAALIR